MPSVLLPALASLEPPLVVPFDHARIDVERLRYLLWNGHHEKVCKPRLGRIKSCTQDAIVLTEPGIEAKVMRLVARCTELRSYVGNNEGALIDDGQRSRTGKPILRAKDTVNQLVSARMNKHSRMRWLPRGTHCMFQVRAAVLDGRFGHRVIQLAA